MKIVTFRAEPNFGFTKDLNLEEGVANLVANFGEAVANFGFFPEPNARLLAERGVGVWLQRFVLTFVGVRLGSNKTKNIREEKNKIQIVENHWKSEKAKKIQKVETKTRYWIEKKHCLQVYDTVFSLLNHKFKSEKILCKFWK